MTFFSKAKYYRETNTERYSCSWAEIADGREVLVTNGKRQVLVCCDKYIDCKEEWEVNNLAEGMSELWERK